MTRSRSPIQTLACAIQRALLILVPRTIRGKYRQEMIATFETACHEAGQRGSLAVCALLVREIGDLLTARRASPHVESAPARREWIQPAAWRQAWRSLARRPAFLVSAVLTLAFGAGRHDGGVFARRHGADQTAPLSRSRSSGDDLRVESVGTREDQPDRAGAARRLAPAEPELRRAVGQLQRERHGHERC